MQALRLPTVCSVGSLACRLTLCELHDCLLLVAEILARSLALCSSPFPLQDLGEAEREV